MTEGLDGGVSPCPAGGGAAEVTLVGAAPPRLFVALILLARDLEA